MSTVDIADIREAVPWFALDVVVVWEERVPPGERKNEKVYIQCPLVYELKNYLALKTVQAKVHGGNSQCNKQNTTHNKQ